LNVLYGVGPQLDWPRLIANLGDDLPLLSGLLSVFTWLAPQRAREFPSSIWDPLRLRPPGEQVDEAVMRQRAQFLDIRPWFLPSEDQKVRKEGC
jgi:hypothetical protein